MAIAAFEKDQIQEVPEIHFSFGGFVGRSTSKSLQKDFADIAEAIGAQIDKTSLQLLGCGTVDEFISLRHEVFPLVLNLTKAYSNLTLAALPPTLIGRIVSESLIGTEDEFTSQGKAYLSDDDYREALFSISTLKSTQKLIPRLIAIKPSDDVEDAKLADRYFSNTVYARMHLDCLRMAMEREMSLNQDILRELLDGMRASLMAYSYARAGLELRGLPNYSDGDAQEEIIWDEEDQSLADAE